MSHKGLVTSATSYRTCFHLPGRRLVGGWGVAENGGERGETRSLVLLLAAYLAASLLAWPLSTSLGLRWGGGS